MSALECIRKGELGMYLEYWLDFHAEALTLHESNQVSNDESGVSEIDVDSYYLEERLAHRISKMRQIYARLRPREKRLLQGYLWPGMFTEEYQEPIDHENDEHFITILKDLLMNTKEALEQVRGEVFTLEYIRPYKEAAEKRKMLVTSKDLYFKAVYSHFSLTGSCNEEEARRVLSVEAATFRIMQMKQSYLRRIERCDKNTYLWQCILNALDESERSLLELILSNKKSSNAVDQKSKEALSVKVRQVYEELMKQQEVLKEADVSGRLVVSKEVASHW